VAWRFVAHLTEREAIDYLCTELPPNINGGQATSSASAENGEIQTRDEEASEQTPLLDGTENVDDSFYDEDDDIQDTTTVFSGSLDAEFANLNALEIAAIAGAKHFLSEKSIQRVVNGIWKGDIIFWYQTHGQNPTLSETFADPFAHLSAGIPSVCTRPRRLDSTTRTSRILTAV